ncbi:MAG: class I SAM-dependent methyltransferase [Bacteroidota bacterium]|nr:class I SAM-dependent methyltransferase [Bacteroidota bacterium]MDP4229712.1 class I SAM-dependent methyltransferase [Bacteroidota bacterium]MDP4236990.1 class I SAM-dependent methyltransferase [Bacteroidota bacterium]
MQFQKEDFESVVCDFCGADDYTKRYEKRGFWMVQCNKCGLVYTNPRLKQEKIAALYDADYFQGHGFDRSIDYVKDVKDHTKGTDGYTLEDWDCDTILSLLPQERRTNARLLEIGCGTGVFLDKARKHGFECQGLELSEYAANFVRQMGIPVETKSIEDANYPPESFDAIVMREVIEHLPHPLDSLKTIHSWLRPGGVLFMATGNYDCPERKLRGSDWFYFMPEGHLNIFSNSTMRKYLQKVGFRKVDVTNQGDKLMDMLKDWKILTPNVSKPRNIFKRSVFIMMRSINHFISSGMRIYAVK